MLFVFAAMNVQTNKLGYLIILNTMHYDVDMRKFWRISDYVYFDQTLRYLQHKSVDFLIRRISIAFF